MANRNSPSPAHPWRSGYKISDDPMSVAVEAREVQSSTGDVQHISVVSASDGHVVAEVYVELNEWDSR